MAIALRGSTAPFTHADGLAGETPDQQILAVRSLYLLRTIDDPSPVRVFDLGAAAKEADLLSGSPTEIASVPVRSLSAGVFTFAKVGAAYVRYRVAARLHAGATSVDGAYANVQALSDGAVIDGVTHAKGWFRYSFVAGGTPYGALEGDDAPTPVPSAGVIGLDTSGPESFYVFPVTVAVDPNTTHDWQVLVDVNVDHCFRWQDQSSPGYATGVFDTTPSTFEPVLAFGANAIAMTYTAK